MTKSSETQSLDLPIDVVTGVERRLPQTEFDTAEAYITYVLRTVLARVETESNQDFNEVDETKVKNQLKSLGYLNE